MPDEPYNPSPIGNPSVLARRNGSSKSWPIKFGKAGVVGVAHASGVLVSASLLLGVSIGLVKLRDRRKIGDVHASRGYCERRAPLSTRRRRAPVR